MYFHPGAPQRKAWALRLTGLEGALDGYASPTYCWGSALDLSRLRAGFYGDYTLGELLSLLFVRYVGTNPASDIPSLLLPYLSATRPVYLEAEVRGASGRTVRRLLLEMLQAGAPPGYLLSVRGYGPYLTGRIPCR